MQQVLLNVCADIVWKIGSTFSNCLYLYGEIVMKKYGLILVSLSLMLWGFLGTAQADNVPANENADSPSVVAQPF